MKVLLSWSACPSFTLLVHSLQGSVWKSTGGSGAGRVVMACQPFRYFFNLFFSPFFARKCVEIYWGLGGRSYCHGLPALPFFSRAESLSQKGMPENGGAQW